jgi:diguanylate cyclase (GGDEF)-like protein/putative nucleotidyltransferase with HDIG domain
VSESVLSDITHLLVSEDSPSRVLNAVSEALAELVPYDTLSLYQADLSLRALRPVLVLDAYADEILADGVVPFGRGITGLTAESRVPQLVNDLHLDSRAHQVPNTPVEPESLLAIPLLAREELKGVLCLYRLGERHHFSVGDFKMAIVFSELAALAIDNAQIRAKLESEVVTDHLTALFNHRYFHERLAEELRRAHRRRTTVGLLIYDIDDFKRVNDTYGHLVGDQVLQGVASVSRETCRFEDVICRIGGEEFAVILPGYSLEEARMLAERLSHGIAQVSFPMVGRITVSVGVAEGPLQASAPRELIACADLAMLDAKTFGKDRVSVYGQPDIDGHVAPGLTTRGELRSEAQLRMLQSLSAKLNRLNDVRQIGDVITDELRSLVDYHNCRVHLLKPGGRTLLPIAFRGTLSEYQGETFDALVTDVGEGITGRVAMTGQSYYAPNANDDPYAVIIPGTPELDESILIVPLRYGERIIGTVTLSKLGVDQFDEEDIRLLEALASNAAVAFENASLLQKEREAAETAGALLHLSQILTSESEVTGVLDAVVAAVPSMVSCSRVGAWVRDVETGKFEVVRHQGYPPESAEKVESLEILPEMAAALAGAVQGPYVIPKEDLPTLPPEYRLDEEPTDVLVAPMRWEPGGAGMLVATARTPQASFTDRELQLARGIADITSLALGNAGRFVELEQAYLSTVEALANALEAKDEYTEDHCRALAELSLAVGSELGLEGERLKVLELGALFHDIGKIGVPSEIIRKPGPLTAAERREMNRHPEVGEQILAPVPFLQPVRPIIRSSHERWDGAGYPDGLAGEQIPLESRIVFVCDAFHAMTTDRPYRAALPESEAIRRLKLSSGTQFDPAVVKAFVHLHKQGKVHFHQG